MLATLVNLVLSGCANAGPLVAPESFLAILPPSVTAHVFRYEELGADQEKASRDAELARLAIDFAAERRAAQMGPGVMSDPLWGDLLTADSLKADQFFALTPEWRQRHSVPAVIVSIEPTGLSFGLGWPKEFDGKNWVSIIHGVADELGVDPVGVMVGILSVGCQQDGVFMLDRHRAQVGHLFRCGMMVAIDPVQGSAPLDRVAPMFFQEFLPGDADVVFEHLTSDYVQLVVRNVRGLVEHGGTAWERIELIVELAKSPDGNGVKLQVVADARLAYGAGDNPPDTQYIYPASETTNYAATVFTALDQYLTTHNLYSTGGGLQ